MKLKFITVPVAVGLALAGLAACGSSGDTPSGQASRSAHDQDINAKARDQLTQGGEVRLEIGSMAALTARLTRFSAFQLAAFKARSRAGSTGCAHSCGWRPQKSTQP